MLLTACEKGLDDVGYDLTSVGLRIGEHRLIPELSSPVRSLSLKEHNIYANVTHRASIGRGYSLFTGIANSSVFTDIDDARMAGDHYHNFRHEVHLKAEMRKACTHVLKVSAGVEDYIRSSTMRYDASHYRLNYNILAAHVDAQWRIVPRVFLNASARAEKLWLGKLRSGMFLKSDCLLMPRATLSYIPNKHLQFSLVAGRYSQTADDDCLAQSRSGYCQSTADHAVLSVQYKSQASLLRIEPYWTKQLQQKFFEGMKQQTESRE